MARGIIYVMKTVVPGLVKIGKTGLANFEARMYQLEHNSYFNVAECPETLSKPEGRE